MLIVVGVTRAEILCGNEGIKKKTQKPERNGNYGIFLKFVLNFFSDEIIVLFCNYIT